MGAIFQKRGWRRQHERWIVLALLWFLYFSFGAVFRSTSLLVTPIIKDLNINYSQMGFVLGSWQLTYIVLAALSGVIMDRWGIRRSIFVGVLVIGLSAVLRSLAVGFYTLMVFVALFGVGGPMVSIGCPKAIAQWFQGKEKSMAVGIYITGTWIGGTFSCFATNGLIMPLVGHSWRLTFVFYGIITGIIAALWWALSNDSEREEEIERFSPFRVLLQLLKVHNVRMVLLSGLLYFGLMHGYLAWLPKILESDGMSPSKAGLASAIPLISGIPGVLIIPRIVSNRYRGRYVGLLAVIAGLSILSLVVWGLPMIPGLLVFGIAGSCIMPMLVLILMENPDISFRYLGSITGVFFGFAEIGGFFGPLMVGFLVDLGKDFSAGAYFLSILGLVVFILMLTLNKERTESHYESLPVI